MPTDRVTTEYIANLKGDLPKKAKQTSKELKGVEKTSLASKVAIAALSAAVIKLAGDFGRMLQAAADARNELADMSARTGVAASTLGGFQLALEGSGRRLSDLNEILNPLNQRIAQAAKGNKEAADTFKMFGIELRNNDGTLRSTDNVLRQVIDSLGAMESQSDKARAASLLLGEGGSKLLQALGNTEDLERFVDEFERFGVDVGPEAIAVSAEWQRTMASMQNVMRGLRDELFAVFGPSGIRLMQMGTEILIVGFRFAAAYIERTVLGLKGLLQTFQLMDRISRKAIAGGMDPLSATRLAMEAGATFAEGFTANIDARLSAELVQTFDDLDDLWSQAGDVAGEDFAGGFTQKLEDEFQKWLEGDGKHLFKAAPEALINFQSQVNPDGTPKAGFTGEAVPTGFTLPSSATGAEDMARRGEAGRNPFSANADFLLATYGGPYGAAVVAISNIPEMVAAFDESLQDLVDGLMGAPDALRQLPEIFKDFAKQLPELVKTLAYDFQIALYEVALWFAFAWPVELMKAIPAIIEELWTVGIDWILRAAEWLVRELGQLITSPFKDPDTGKGRILPEGGKNLFNFLRGPEGRILGTNFNENAGELAFAGVTASQLANIYAPNSQAAQSAARMAPPTVVTHLHGYADDQTLRRMADNLQTVLGPYGYNNSLTPREA